MLHHINYLIGSASVNWHVNNEFYKILIDQLNHAVLDFEKLVSQLM